MTLSINCKDAGDPVCTHTMYGETEEELLKNAKEHGIKEHGYTEETWNEKMSKERKIQDINKIILNQTFSCEYRPIYHLLPTQSAISILVHSQ